MDLPPQPISQPTTPTLPRKSPLTAIIIILLVIAVLAVTFFVVRKILSLSKKSEPATLTYWGLWESKSIIEPLITEYQTSHPDVKIDYVFQSPREYRERLQNALSQGRGPDIFRLHNSWVPMFKSDLSPIPATAYSASSFESTFYPVARDLRVGNQYVAIPLEIDGLAMYINDDLFNQAGATPPVSWDDLRQTAIALCTSDAEDGKCRPGNKILLAGAALGTADNIDHWQDILAVLMLQNNVNLNSPTGKPAEDALDYYSLFTRTDHVWDSTLPNSTTAFATGKVAIYFAPSWRVFDIQAINPNLKFSVHSVPQLPLDISRGEQPVTWASYWAEGVNAKSTNTKQAWEFLTFLSSQDSLQKLYQSAAASGRAFGEPYSRVNMADSLKTAPYVGPYISQAPYARSWYIASSTFDGPTGINSLLTNYFADAVNSINQGRSSSEAIKTLNAGINQVLSRYGLAPALPQ